MRLTVHFLAAGRVIGTVHCGCYCSSGE